MAFTALFSLADRPEILWEFTRSLCPTCKRVIDAGFGGWFLVNGLLWGWIFGLDSQAMGGNEEGYFLFIIPFPLNIAFVIVLARNIKFRPIAGGILAALAVNLVVSLVRGIYLNGFCLIPFFFSSAIYSPCMLLRHPHFVLMGGTIMKLEKKEYTTRAEKQKDFAIGVGLFLCINLILALLIYISYNYSSVSAILASIRLCLSILALPINLGLLIYFSLTRGWIALGMSVIFAVLVLLGMIGGIIASVQCLINLDWSQL